MGLFIYLTLLLIILELSLAGLCYTQSTGYLITVVIATLGINLIIYVLYSYDSNNSSKLMRNEYHFHYTDNAFENDFYYPVRKRI